MTNIALVVQTDMTRLLFSITLPTYRPSPLLGVIIALALAILGLAADPLLLPAGPVGALALWPALIALGIVIGLLALELRPFFLPPSKGGLRGVSYGGAL